MRGDRDTGRFVLGFVVPLLLTLAGGGLLFLPAAMGGLIVDVAGIGLIGIGLVWVFISCVREGINLFDL